MFSPRRLLACFSTRQRLLATASLLLLGQTFGQPLHAASFALYGDPTFSFGNSPPDVGFMAAAIQTRMGIPISVVTILPNENTGSGLLADSNASPFYAFGPSANGVIKNLNLNVPVLTGLTSGSLRSDGFEVDVCGDFVERFVLRVFSGGAFFDVLVRPASCSGIDNVLWSFYQVSSARPVTNPTPPPSPTPFPVQLVSTVSRFTHGMAGPFDINLPLAGPAGVECRRTVGAAGSYTIVYNFRRTLNSVYSATISRGVGQVQNSGIGADPHQYIVNLTNVTNAQTIAVTLNFVQDDIGHVSNAVNANMSVLVGDTTDNGNVGSADVRQVQAQVGMLVTAANFRDDVNHDGVIDINDVNLVKKQKRTSLPRASVK